MRAQNPGFGGMRRCSQFQYRYSSSWMRWKQKNEVKIKENSKRSSMLPPSEIECGALLPRPIIIPARQNILFWFWTFVVFTYGGEKERTG